MFDGEPVVVLDFVKAVLGLAVVFGVAVSPEQSEAILGTVAAGYALVFAILTRLTRDRVTPADKA